MDLPELTEARVVTVHPGDIIVLRTSGPLSLDSQQRVRDMAELAFGTKVVVLEGFELDMLRQED